MKQNLPWLVAAIAIVTAVVTFNELQRMRGRFTEVTKPFEFHEHSEVRRFIIKAQLASVDRPIIVFGDSLVEEVILPRTLCGNPVINAGIGGATTYRFQRFVADAVKDYRPSLVVLAFGTNDVLFGNKDFSSDYEKLVSGAGPRPVLLSIPKIDGHDVRSFNDSISAIAKASGLPFVSLDGIEKEKDGIHLGPGGMRRWSDLVEKAISARCESTTTQ